MNLTRKRVRRLNALPELRALNKTHLNESAAGEAFVALLDAAADREGVIVTCGSERCPNMMIACDIHHTLEVDGELVDDSVFVRQVYITENERCEVTAYFS